MKEVSRSFDNDIHIRLYDTFYSTVRAEQRSADRQLFQSLAKSDFQAFVFKAVQKMPKTL